jgi:hypothetical protein
MDRVFGSDRAGLAEIDIANLARRAIEEIER